MSEQGLNINGGTPTKDLDKLEDEIKDEKHELDRKGYPAMVLIEVDGDVYFDKIRDIIRTSAKAGIDRFLFATKQHEMHPNELEHALLLELPGFRGCGPAPVIEPLFIKADKSNQILINKGLGQELVEPKTAPRELHELNSRLEVYIACARAGGQAPQCEIYVSKSCSYQRFIDVLNTLTLNDITHYVFTDVAEDFDTKGSAPAISKKPVAPQIRNPIRPRSSVQLLPGR